MSEHKWHIDNTKLFLHNILVCKKTENCEVYHLNDKHHNPNGPAYRTWDGNGQLRYEEYWLDDEEFTKEQYLAKLNK